MTLHVAVHPGPGSRSFDRDQVVRMGRSRASDVRVGHLRVQGRWTVSTRHVEVAWDGIRWITRNVSDKAGLLWVYEPGYEEVPLEPGRPWAPVRHRWAYALGHPAHRFAVVCATDDHAGATVRFVQVPAHANPGDRADAVVGEPDTTAALERAGGLGLTPLEREVLDAYYADFVALPRPAVLEPRAHDDAARRLGRSRDSTRKAIERVNEKINRAPDAPAIATGRNVSSEIGRWLARAGALDPADPGSSPNADSDRQGRDEGTPGVG